MDGKFPHLDPQVAALIGEGDEVRIQACKKPRWIPNRYNQRILGKLEYLRSFPTSVDMPNLLIAAESGSGKTSTVKEFLRRHPHADNINGEHASMPIVYCEAAPAPDLGGFYNRILMGLGHEPQFGLVEARRYTVERTLGLLDTRVLIVDEVQHGLQAGPQTQRTWLSGLKSLGNLGIALVAVGTREAMSLFSRDPQIKRRFTYETISAFKLDREFIGFLLTWESLLPLRFASNLNNSTIARRIHERSRGNVARLARLFAMAAEKAITTGEERITLEIVEQVDLDDLTDQG